MNKKHFIIGMSIIILFVFLYWYFIPSSLLDRLNLGGADIEPEEKYFRWIVSIDGGKYTYTSENISWNDMVRYGFIVDGELNMDNTFWKCVLDARNKLYFGEHCYTFYWEAYY